jgi:hypothetical protein
MHDHVLNLSTHASGPGTAHTRVLSSALVQSAITLQQKHLCHRGIHSTKPYLLDLNKWHHTHKDWKPGQLSNYNVWLRTGWPGDRGSIPGRGKGFFL